MNEKYKDMLHLPHPVSAARPRMALQDRAAQFSPFAALTGYDDALRETARLTERFIELDEDGKQEIDRQISYLQQHPLDTVPVKIIYFVPDEKKDGGSYRRVAGHVKKIDWYEKKIVLTEAGTLEIGHIVEMDSALWENMEF